MTSPTPNYRAAKDIPDDVFLDAVRQLQHAGACRSRWNVEAVLAGLPVDRAPYDEVPGVPSKVVLAKAAKLIRRGLLHGCACGCRGDFEIPEKVREQ